MTKETKQDVFNESVKELTGQNFPVERASNPYLKLMPRYANALDGRAGCVYCYNSNGINIFDQDDFHIGFSSLSNGSLIFASGNTSVSLKVNYCPMCGRSLGASHE